MRRNFRTPCTAPRPIRSSVRTAHMALRTSSVPSRRSAVVPARITGRERTPGSSLGIVFLPAPSGRSSTPATTTPPDARYEPAVGATEGKLPAATHVKLTASEPCDEADLPVTFLGAIHIREHSVMLVLQQPTRKTGILAPASASSCRSGLKDPPPLRRHQATASPVRHRCHDVDAMVVTPAGPAGGRKAIVRHRAGHRDTS
jgi:hypothetical protein